jgi:probable F420-dependent oxidoreductase
MEVGLVVIPSDQSAPITELAREAEDLQLDSLYIGGDHTHVPTRRTTPFPLGGELPEEYRRCIDPIVAATAAAVVTSRIRLGTCIYLTAQRDAIDTAKKIASLDHLSGGRFDFGIGFGWNVEEAENHGVRWSERRALVREQVLAMKALWTEEAATFTGEHVSFDESWMWPKPASRPYPPVLLGASPGQRTFDAIVEWADGWFPVPFWGHRPDDVNRLRQAAADAGRDPDELRIVVDGVLPDAAQAAPWDEVGADAVLIPVPSEPLADVLPVLDAAAALRDHFSTQPTTDRKETQ